MSLWFKRLASWISAAYARSLMIRRAASCHFDVFLSMVVIRTASCSRTPFNFSDLVDTEISSSPGIPRTRRGGSACPQVETEQDGKHAHQQYTGQAPDSVEGLAFAPVCKEQEDYRGSYHVTMHPLRHAGGH